MTADIVQWLAIASCVIVPSALAYHLASRWLAAREAVAGLATKKDVAEVRARCEVHDKAIGNLAREVDEKVSELRGQQVGLIAGMGQRARSFGAR